MFLLHLILQRRVNLTSSYGSFLFGQKWLRAFLSNKMVFVRAFSGRDSSSGYSFPLALKLKYLTNSSGVTLRNWAWVNSVSKGYVFPCRKLKKLTRIRLYVALLEVFFFFFRFFFLLVHASETVNCTYSKFWKFCLGSVQFGSVWFGLFCFVLIFRFGVLKLTVHQFNRKESN